MTPAAARRFNRLSAWLEQRSVMAFVSLFILAGVVAAGYRVLPARFLPWEEAGTAFRSTYNMGYWAGRGGAVFLIGDDLFPYQCGSALVEAPFSVRIRAFEERGCAEHLETRLVRLYEADLRVPWALIPESDRTELKAFGREAMAYLRGSILAAVASPYFDLEYRPVLADIIRTALRRAWYAPVTQVTLSRAARTLDPHLVDRVTAGLLPIVLERAESTFWQTLKGYAGSLVGGGKETEGSPLTRVTVDLLRDERVHAHLVETLPALAASGEMTGLASTLASEMGMALLDDPRMLPLASRMLTDSRLLGDAPAPSPLGGKRLTRDLPRWLMRLRHERDHNPLVSQVVKNLIRGRSGFLVLLMTPAQQELLVRGDLPAGIGLVAEGR
ncbi:MAG: hypothetical protein H7841_02485 [Magnetospirillum sp. WYHS-4]